MGVRKWEDVERELFAGRDDEIAAAEQRLRDEARSFQPGAQRAPRGPEPHGEDEVAIEGEG